MAKVVFVDDGSAILLLEDRKTRNFPDVACAFSHNFGETLIFNNGEIFDTTTSPAYRKLDVDFLDVTSTKTSQYVFVLDSDKRVWCYSKIQDEMWERQTPILVTDQVLRMVLVDSITSDIYGFDLLVIHLDDRIELINSDHGPNNFSKGFYDIPELLDVKQITSFDYFQLLLTDRGQPFILRLDNESPRPRPTHGYPIVNHAPNPTDHFVISPKDLSEHLPVFLKTSGEHRLEVWMPEFINGLINFQYSVTVNPARVSHGYFYLTSDGKVRKTQIDRTPYEIAENFLDIRSYKRHSSEFDQLVCGLTENNQIVDLSNLTVFTKLPEGRQYSLTKPFSFSRGARRVKRAYNS